MTEDNQAPKKKHLGGRCDGTAGAVYGLGLVGAAVYYIQQADNFLTGTLGLLKALVWPAILVYELFKFLN